MNTKLTLTGATGPRFMDLSRGDFFLTRDDPDEEGCVFLKTGPIQGEAVCVYSTNGADASPRGVLVRFLPHNPVRLILVEEIKGRTR